MPYEIIEKNEESLDQLRKNFLDPSLDIRIKNKKIRVQLEIIQKSLREILQREEDNPFFSEVLEKIEKTRNVAEKIITFYEIYNGNKGPLEKS